MRSDNIKTVNSQKNVASNTKVSIPILSLVTGVD